MNLTAARILGASTVVFAPDVPEVKLGQMTFTPPVPRSAKIFNLDCVSEITVGTETEALPAQRGAIVVAASKQACLSSGVLLYGSGSDCEPESSERLTGRLVYSFARGVPDFMFEGVTDREWTSSKCANRTYVQLCGG